MDAIRSPASARPAWAEAEEADDPQTLYLDNLSRTSVCTPTRHRKSFWVGFLYPDLEVLKTPKKGRKSCKACLWNWDLYDTGFRECYNIKSPKIHKPASGGCKEYEEQPVVAPKDRYYPPNQSA